MSSSAAKRLGVLLLASAAFLLGSCGDTYQVAVRVGDLELSHSDVASEAAVWGRNADLMSQLGISSEPRDGTAPQLVVNEILNLHIQGELARIATEDAAATPEGRAQLDQLRPAIEADFGPLFADFPDDVRERIFDDVVYLQFLSTVGGAAPDTDVYLSPRYGSTDLNRVVQAPEGPLGGPAPGILGT